MLHIAANSALYVDNFLCYSKAVEFGLVDSWVWARDKAITYSDSGRVRVPCLCSLCFFPCQVLGMIGLVTHYLPCTLNPLWWHHLQCTSLGITTCLHLLDSFMGTHHWFSPVWVHCIPDQKPWMPPIHSQFHMYFLPLSLETPTFRCHRQLPNDSPNPQWSHVKTLPFSLYHRNHAALYGYSLLPSFWGGNCEIK